MPDKRRPAVVEHPLDDTRRAVLVAGISLEHGAFAVVGHGLRFAKVVVERSGSAIAAGHSVGEDIDVGEALAAGVVVPHLVDRPEMILGNELLEAFARR